MSSSKPTMAIIRAGSIRPKYNCCFKSIEKELKISKKEPIVIGVIIASPPRYATGFA